MKNCQKNAIFFPMLTLTPNLWCFIFAIFLPLALIYVELYLVNFCRFIAVCRRQLVVNCRLPTAMKNTAKRPV